MTNNYDFLIPFIFIKQNIKLLQILFLYTVFYLFDK